MHQVYPKSRLYVRPGAKTWITTQIGIWWLQDFTAAFRINLSPSTNLANCSFNSVSMLTDVTVTEGSVDLLFKLILVLSSPRDGMMLF